MKLSELTKTWRGAKVENTFHRVILSLSSVAVVVLAYGAVNKSTVVTLVSPTLKTEAWVGIDNAQQDYKTSWALYLSQLLGNVTPGNAQFIVDAIGPLLDPEIYQQTVAAIHRQAEQITQDGVTLRFQGRKVQYETTSKKAFVQGYSYVSGNSGEEERTTRTYEFVIQIQDYAPLITDIDTYEGRARTEDVLSKIEGRSERRK
ncbi:TraE/TraK family type IV conjugative transfer system protein [Salinisphaera sp. T31B1]|uniref:TraE/TraK family type IV conjugative transfer system protein n=1 Tax=Salinisphaera sp. T31B1 TaxID=727963 RepID=UPI0033404055